MKYTITFDKDYIIDVTWDYSPMRKDTFSETKVVELEGRELSQAIDKKRKELGLENSHQVPALTKKEKRVQREFTYKKLFEKGTSFTSKDGLNILVGDNGCGKSTLIRELVNNNPIKNLMLIDMERANPTISRPDPENGFLHGYTPEELINQYRSFKFFFSCHNL